MKQWLEGQDMSLVLCLIEAFKTLWIHETVVEYFRALAHLMAERIKSVIKASRENTKYFLKKVSFYLPFLLCNSSMKLFSMVIVFIVFWAHRDDDTEPREMIECIVMYKLNRSVRFKRRIEYFWKTWSVHYSIKNEWRVERHENIVKKPEEAESAAEYWELIQGVERVI